MNINIFNISEAKKFSIIEFFKTAIFIPLVLIINVLVFYIFTNYFGVYDSSTKSTNSFFSDFLSFGFLIFFLCILIPIFEEFLYRMPLRFTNIQQKVILIIQILGFVYIIALKNNSSNSILIFQLVIFIIGLIFFAKNKFLDSKEISSPVFIWFSITLFCLLHSAKYPPTEEYSKYILLLIMKILQFCPLAIFLTYVRLKFVDGYAISVLNHGLFNLLVLLIAYFAK